MQKLVLVPAALALSANFAFAVEFDQIVKLNQSIGNTSKGGFARNRAFVLQAPVPVNVGQGSISQNVTLNQSIGDTTTGGKAVNNAVILQNAMPFSY